MRQDHLTEQQILAFKARSLSPSELLRVDDHLSSCSACRDRMWDTLNADRMVASLRNQFHSAADPSVHIPAAATHSWVTVGIWTAAAAILIGVTIGFFALRQPAVTVSTTAANQPIPEGPVGARAATPLPADYQEAIDLAKREGKLERAPLLKDLIRKQGTLLAAGTEEASFSVISPVGTAVLSDRPVLKWQAVPNASSYVVSIFGDDYRKVAQSPSLAATEWQPVTGLKRGQNYSWQVTAIVRGETIKLPKPPVPEALFRVLSPEKVDALERAKGEAGDSHLALGILYAKEGLLDDSEAELRLANPTEARPLLDNLSQIRHP